LDTRGMRWIQQRERRKGSPGFTPIRRSVWGFTLLELLMVVIIIGILASIALPTYLKTAERARAAEALTILGAIRASELRYQSQSQNNVYASNTGDLDMEVPVSSTWGYTIPLGTPPIARATRATTNATIDINLSNGTTCTSAAAMYGLGTAC